MDFDKEIEKFAKQIDVIVGILDTDQQGEGKKLTDLLEKLTKQQNQMTLKQQDRFIKEKFRLEQIMKLSANQKELMRKVTYFVERRTIFLKGDEFIGITDEGKKVKIDEDILMRYLENLLNRALEDNGSRIDLLNVLYSLDQEAFYQGQLEDDDGNGLTYEESIQELKGMLKGQCEDIPEVVAVLMKKTKESTKEHAEIDKKFNGYILQLLKEGVITENVIIEAELLKDINRDDLIEFYKQGLITKSLLVNSTALKNTGKENLNVLIKLGFFEDLSSSDLMKLQENGFINPKNIIELYNSELVDRDTMLKALGGAENIVTSYKRAVRNKNKKDANLYFELLTPSDVCAFYMNGKLSSDDLAKVEINKEVIAELPEDEFLKFAQRGFPEGIAFTSDELIEGYISKYSGATLVALAKGGHIEPEKLLSLIDIEVEPENIERAITAKELYELYTPSTILNMLAENKIDIEFIQDLDTRILLAFDEDERAEYMSKIIEGSLYKMEEFQYAQTMIDMLKSGQFPQEYFKELKISENVLIDMLLEESLSTEQAVEYFNSGILSEKVIEIIYGEDYDNVINLIKQGELEEKALVVLPIEVLQGNLIHGEDLQPNKLTPEDIFKIYAVYGTLPIAELSSMFEEYGNKMDKRVHIVSMIGEGFDVNKIKELYLYDVLTHSDLLELQESGIITEEQCEEISKMDLAKFYKEIFDQDKRIENIYDESQTENEEGENDRGEGTGLPSVPKFLEISAKAKKEFFTSLGAYDYQDIESFDSEGREAPFSNYKMLGFLDYGLAVFENFEESGNATYIMTFQELKSYIIKEAEKSIVFKKSKQALREEIASGRAVRVCNHTVNWGNNVIKAMKELSKDARSGIREADLQELIARIQTEYRLAKEMQLEAEKEALEMARAKQNEVIELERRTKEKFDKRRGNEHGEK